MIVETGWIDGVTCCECSAASAMPLVTFAPGADATYGPGNILIARAVPARGWCLACAQRHGWLQKLEGERPTWDAA